MCPSAVKPQEDGGVSDQLYAEIKPAVDGANYIIKHMHNKNNYNEVRMGVALAPTLIMTALFQTHTRGKSLAAT